MAEHNDIVRTSAAKENRLRICEKHADILNTIYYLGHGYINANQLFDFLAIFNPTYTKKRFWKCIRELENNFIINIISKVNHQSLIILRKSALMYILKKDTSTNLNSIKEPSMNLYIDSVLRIQSIITSVEKAKIDAFTDVNSTISYLSKNTTLLCKSKQVYKFLETQNNIKSARITKEIEVLKEIHHNDFKKLDKNQISQPKTANLNDMHKHRIFIKRMRPDSIILSWCIGSHMKEKTFSRVYKDAVFLMEYLATKGIKDTNEKPVFKIAIWCVNESVKKEVDKFLMNIAKSTEGYYLDKNRYCFFLKDINRYTHILKGIPI